MTLVAICGAALTVVQGYSSSVAAQGTLRDLRSTLVAHLCMLPLSFFFTTPTGEILNRASNDVDMMEGVLSNTLPTIVSNFATVIGTIIVMLLMDWRLALVAFLVLPLMVIPVGPLSVRLSRVLKDLREARDKLGALLGEVLSISGMLLTKTFSREDYEKERFFVAGTRVMNAETRMTLAMRWYGGITNGIVIFGPALVWLFGGYLVTRSAATPGTVVAFVALLSRLYGPTTSLMSVQAQFATGNTIITRLRSYFQLEPERYDGEQITAGPVRRTPSSITFRDVSFGYGNGQSVLRNFTLRIEAGERVALVGPSGAGKSTTAFLLMRLFGGYTGKIEIDNIDVLNIDLRSLRRRLGFVGQDTFLLHDTITSNIRYGRLDATMQDVETAAQIAGVTDFIATLPEGFDTVVGERGYALSAGQRQRISIARTMLRNPDIVILDEATSSLDAIIEQTIKRSLGELMAGRTSLIIAHRLSTIIDCDRIAVIQHGRICEIGSHKELLEKKGLYAQLYSIQRDINATPL